MASRNTRTVNTLRKHAAMRGNGFLPRAQTDHLPPGTYPSNWDSMGVAGAYEHPHYLHSTIRGFNADYQSMTDADHALTMFDRLYNRQKEQTQRQIDYLIAAAKAAKPQLGLTESQDIMESKLCQLLYNGDSIYNHVRTLALKLKSASLKPNKEDLQKTGGMKAWLQQASTQMSAYMTEMTTLLQDPQFSTSAIHKVKLFDDFITHVNEELAQSHPFIYWRGEENTINGSKQETLHQRLGFVWEKLIEAAYHDSVQNTVNENNIFKALTEEKNFNLSDLLLGKAVQLDLQGQDERALIKVGGSAKFTTNGSFVIKANNAAISPQQILERAGINTSNNHELDLLAYIYDNYTALTLFESDKYFSQGIDSKMQAGETKRSRRQFRRNETLQQWPSIFRQIFQKFADYVYLAVISAAFFGNSTDYGNQKMAAPVFNLDYVDTIMNNLNNTKNNQGLPAFLFTSQRAFETGKLLQIIFNQSTTGALSDASEVLFATLLAPPSWAYVGDWLKEIYASKCEALNDSMLVAQYGTIYDILRASDAIFGVSNWHPLKYIMTRKSRIKFEFDPTHYLK